ncbi:MAG: hypothetical protein GX128_05920 [Bacteroidales bacterium]|nr:hypothetical protein [Bacteroidales bacterium]
MKQVAVLIMAVLISLQPTSKLWVYISFKINQENIARTLCENKDSEKNTCHGKCYLKKQLAKAEQEEQKQLPANLKEVIEWLYDHQYEFYGFLSNQTLANGEKLISCDNDLYVFSMITGIFRPPRFSQI